MCSSEESDAAQKVMYPRGVKSARYIESSGLVRVVKGAILCPQKAYFRSRGPNEAKQMVHAATSLVSPC